MSHHHYTVKESSYQPLLRLISTAESNRNANAYFGNAANQSLRFTNMTIRQVRDWQARYVQAGNPSSAVGKYQIISTTLTDLLRQKAITDGQRFDEATQDKLAIRLIERRGSEDYVNHRLSARNFAAQLAQEWASLPRATGPQPEKSYYDSALNHSLVSVNDVLAAIAKIQAQ